MYSTMLKTHRLGSDWAGFATVAKPSHLLNEMQRKLSAKESKFPTMAINHNNEGLSQAEA